MDFNERLALPEYPEYRAYLKDPTEAAYISDLALSLESELSIINIVIGFEDIELTPNVCVQLSESFGLEASKFAEVAKRGYYMFKQRARQLVTYIFNFFLEMLRGSTDVKAVMKSYAKKTDQYIESFKKLRIDHDESKKIEIREFFKRVPVSILTIEMTCISLDSILNEMHKLEKSKDTVQVKMMKFVRGLQLLNASMDYSKFLEISTNKDEYNSYQKSVADSIKERFSGNNLNVSDESDVIKKMDKTLADMKKFYSSEVKKSDISYKSAYEYTLKGLEYLQNKLKDIDELEYWDFKTLAKKINVVKDELLKEIDAISNDKNLNETENDKDLAVAIKNIMNTGKYMAKTKDVIAVSLKSFKSDMEIMFTESKKIGSVLYQKQQ